MSDTITSWYTEAGDCPPGAGMPAAELHFNLWRHVRKGLGNRVDDFLDVGVLVENGERLGTLSVYLPFAFNGSPEDLVSRLRDSPRLLSGVFNEVVEPGPAVTGTTFTFTVEKRKSHYLTCHGGMTEDRARVIPIDEKGNRVGTIITFSDKFCERMRAPGRHYLRFRIALDREAAVKFSFRTPAKDRWVQSSWKEKEYTELRVNEMRSAPRSVLEVMRRSDSRSLPVSTVHLFVMREMTYELQVGHSAPHKIRRLEHELWEGYAPERFEAVLNRFVVYHWKKEFRPPVPEESVVVFAKFSHESARIWLYLPLIVVLGALGSMIATILQPHLSIALRWMAALGILALVVYVVPRIADRDS